MVLSTNKRPMVRGGWWFCVTNLFFLTFLISRESGLATALSLSFGGSGIWSSSFSSTNCTFGVEVAFPFLILLFLNKIHNNNIKAINNKFTKTTKTIEKGERENISRKGSAEGSERMMVWFLSSPSAGRSGI